MAKRRWAEKPCLHASLCLLACLLVLNLCACGEVATIPEQAGFGPHPMLPPPNPTLFPTVNIAPAKGWPVGEIQITEPGVKVIDLPAGPINHHWTKNVIAGRDGLRLYVTVGSNSNVGENGVKNEVNRAAIWEVDLTTGSSRIFASGLRNPNGLAWQPQSGELWTAVPERDEIGSDLVAKAIAPDYALGAHTASLGLVFNENDLLPKRFTDGAFIGQHGSWNRQPRSVYKVIFVPFADGQPAGAPEDILTGFVNVRGEALGRPVGVAIDHVGALLVADDVGNIVWRVTPR